MKCLFIAGVALAIISGSAVAGPVIGHATLSDYSFQLIDLDPNDGIAPAITFEYNLLVARAEDFNTDEGDYQSSWALPFPVYASQDLPGASLAASASVDEIQANVTAGGQGDFSAVGYRFSSFRLSANTKMIVTGHASVGLDFGTVTPLHWANAFVTLSFDPYNYNPAPSDVYSLGITGRAGDAAASLDEAFTLELVNDTDVLMYRDLKLTSYVQLNSVTPVPEPSSWLMLGAGLALMAGVARRHRVPRVS